MAHLKLVDLGHVFFFYWQRYENEFFPLLHTKTSFPKTRNQIANEPFLVNLLNRLANESYRIFRFHKSNEFLFGWIPMALLNTSGMSVSSGHEGEAISTETLTNRQAFYFQGCSGSTVNHP
jgi:hypothetical protein